MQNEPIKRDPIDIHYLKMAYLISENSTCTRRSVGAIIVRDNIPLVGGYNGAVSGMKHCTEETCIRKQLNIPSGEKHELCRGAHSEMNAITHAGKYGIKIKDATIYCTTQPCIYCAKAIANSGIKRLVYCEGYGKGMDDLTKEILQNIDVVQISKDKISNVLKNI
jgi:dCMP deaminase